MATRNSNYEDLMLRLSNHINGINLILDIVDINSFPGSSRLENVIAQELIQLRGRIIHIPAANVVHHKGVPDPKHVSTSSCPATKKAVSMPLTKAQEDSKKANGSAIKAPQLNSKKTNGSAIKTSQQDSKKASAPMPTKSQPVKKNNATKNVNVTTPVPATKNAAKVAPTVPKQRTTVELGWHILKKMRETENFQLDADNHFYCVLCDSSMHVNSMLDHIVGRAHKNNSAAEVHADVEDYDDGSYDPVCEMIEEMNNSSYERSVELMWDIVYATDNTIKNIQSSGKWFYCRLCEATLNGPFPVVDHVRGSRHQAD